MSTAGKMLSDAPGKGRPWLSTAAALFLVTVFMIVATAGPAQASKQYIIGMRTFDGTLVFDSLNVYDFDMMSGPDGQGSHSVEAVSIMGQPIHKVFFSPQPFSRFSVAVPYDPLAAKLVVRDQEQLTVFELPVIHYADTCADGICDSHESYESCSADCQSGSSDDFCDMRSDGICDPDCRIPGFDPDCKALPDTPSPKENTATVSDDRLIIFQKQHPLANISNGSKDPKASAAAGPKKEGSSSGVPDENPPILYGASPKAIAISLAGFFIITILSVVYISHKLAKDKIRKLHEQKISYYTWYYTQQGNDLASIQSQLQKMGFTDKEISHSLKRK